MVRRVLLGSVGAMLVVACAATRGDAAAPVQVNDGRAEAVQLFNASIPALNSGDWASAMPKLKRAVELDPQRGEAWVGLGKCQAHLGNVEEALTNLNKGVKLAPDFATGWVELGSANEGCGHLQAAVTAYKQFIARFPNSPEASTVKDLIRDLSRELQAETDAAAKDPATKSGIDYFAFATSKGVSHWASSQMPLKVYVSSPEGKKNYRPAFSEALDRAFDRWQSSSDGRVSFVRVDNASGANIQVNWSDDVHGVASLAEHGETRSEITSEGMQHAIINLLTVEDPNDQDKLTDNLMYGVCLHEIGHALGLRGHSNEPGDMMFYCVPTVDKEFDLSARDIATMVRLYDTPINKSVAVTVAANEEFGGNPGASLNNQGCALIREGKIEDAIKKFEDSLAHEPKDNPARHNLAMSLNSLAVKYCKQGMYAKAEPFYKRSLDMMQGSDGQDKVAVLSNYINVLKLLHRENEASSLQSSLATLTKK